MHSNQRLACLLTGGVGASNVVQSMRGMARAAWEHGAEQSRCRSIGWVSRRMGWSGLKPEYRDVLEPLENCKIRVFTAQGSLRYINRARMTGWGWQGEGEGPKPNCVYCTCLSWAFCLFLKPDVSDLSFLAWLLASPSQKTTSLVLVQSNIDPELTLLESELKGNFPSLTQWSLDYWT